MDDDRKLRKLTYYPEEQEWGEGDIDDDFWDAIKESIPDSETDVRKNFIESFDKIIDSNMEMNFDEF